MYQTTDFSLPNLTKWHQKKYLAYATQVLESQQQIINDEGANILHYILKDQSKYERLTHYPDGDRIDPISGAQYFYHCHRENFDTTEHGHFHCFQRYKQIPKRIKPSPLPDWDLYIENPMTHLIAIGMSQQGSPIRLFTVNRWVTNEIWYDAVHAPYFVKRYQMNLKNPYWRIVDKWVEGMIHLFAPQIAWLHQERDRVMQAHQANHQWSGQLLTKPHSVPLKSTSEISATAPSEAQERGITINIEDNIYLNKDIEEISYIDIDLSQQIQWVIES